MEKCLFLGLKVEVVDYVELNLKWCERFLKCVCFSVFGIEVNG